MWVGMGMGGIVIFHIFYNEELGFAISSKPSKLHFVWNLRGTETIIRLSRILGISVMRCAGVCGVGVCGCLWEWYNQNKWRAYETT